MIVDVTQNLIVRVTPVNTPYKTNAFQERLGYYRAYVVGGDNDRFLLDQAESEIHRGIVPMMCGYGSHSTARIAVLNALDDYADKFGDIARADTDEVA